MRAVSYVVALATIVLTGTLHGQKTGRWRVSREVQTAVQRLQNVPEDIGPWHGSATVLDPEVIRRSGIAGYISRRYVNPASGSQISVLVVCGRPGPISVHTPDVCYEGAGFQTEGVPRKVFIPLDSSQQRAEFNTAEFHREESALSTRLQIFWAWSSEGSWIAPENPRLWFAPARALHKLYVVCPVGASKAERPDEACQDFIRLLVPELSKALFNPAL